MQHVKGCRVRVDYTHTPAVQFLTSLTVGFTLLHVKGLVPDGCLAGGTLETLNMVSHLQGMHDFLMKWEKKVVICIPSLTQVQWRMLPYISL